MASYWIPQLLALEVSTTTRQAQGASRSSQLIREMSLANPLWGAPRIHGELLKLAIAVGQTSVAKYMARYRRPPSQGWRTFLLNHADEIASIDLFLVPTISFRLLLRVAHPAKRSKAHPVARCHCGPDRRMDRPASHRGMRLGARLNTSSVIGTAPTARHLRAAFARWAFATDRQRQGHHGRTDMRSD